VKAQERVFSISSPFDPVFGPQFGQLPTVFKEQFFPPAHATSPLQLVGKMERIWHRPAWLWPFLWLLARADIIFPEVGSDIDASLSVRAGLDRRGEPYLKWDRSFHFKVTRHFNAVMLYDRRLTRIVERMGPLGLLDVVWNMRFEPPDTIYISTEGCVLRIGRRRLWLPRLLCPDVLAVERALDKGNGIAINLRVAHPLLGPIFGYNGVFHLKPSHAHPHGANQK